MVYKFPWPNQHSLLAPNSFQKASSHFLLRDAVLLLLQRIYLLLKPPSLTESAVTLMLSFLVMAHNNMLIELCGVRRDFYSPSLSNIGYRGCVIWPHCENMMSES